MENYREIFQLLSRRFGFLDKNCCSVSGAEISTVHSHILYEIDKQTSPTMQQVSEALGIDATTFSRQVQSLVKMNLVKKTPSTEDRRYYHLTLTIEGKYIATSIDTSMNHYLQELFSHMSEQEKADVIRSITILNEAMGKSSVCCTPVY
ncbi:MarR family winged helix-turn-helix transcriptional regulator [Paenisporosarcina cavernae]|uniref:MarR family transcriptional regulator n=1 Tax=Paenisporosarcina cavernae TaxID=2320858 RepID=A0A385YUV5_9BACL|nr:MarR family winged helix-turn-helix transcriptional regulator [Paenisporosarcina cavernae]AYC30466.1 MarR family transcriptional regulator [Paenisporosarcina cavernae]